MGSRWRIEKERSLIAAAFRSSRKGSKAEGESRLEKKLLISKKKQTGY